MLLRARGILGAEKVSFDDEAVVQVIMKHAPDWRRVLNEMQRGSVGGIYAYVEKSDNIDDLFVHLKNKDFKKMRNWVVNNMDTDSSAIFRGLYDKMYDKLNPQSIPQLVLILADYQYKNAFVADHELNVVACMTEIMANVEFA